MPLFFEAPKLFFSYCATCLTVPSNSIHEPLVRSPVRRPVNTALVNRCTVTPFLVDSEHRPLSPAWRRRRQAENRVGNSKRSPVFFIVDERGWARPAGGAELTYGLQRSSAEDDLSLSETASIVPKVNGGRLASSGPPWACKEWVKP